MKMDRIAPAGAGAIFPQRSREIFAAAYPEVPHKLYHTLRDHPLLALDALAVLGESLPAESLEYNKGDLPIGVDGKPGSNGLSIGETIRHIATSGSWAVLKNIEQVPAYRGLLLDLVEELRPAMEARTGRMLLPQGFVFISSPDAVTPYHFDPEHNILLQLEGSKVMTQFPAGDTRYASDEAHETYQTGGGRELRWDESYAGGGQDIPLAPGEAVFVPVMAPHYVRNGPAPSISLSITWRSEWSYAEAYTRVFNKRLRALGLKPKAPGRWPRANRTKSLAHRLTARFTR